MNKIKKLFYGWIVVFACAVVLAVGLGMYTSTNSVFVKPICDSLGFSRGSYTLHRTIIYMVGAALLPLFGKIIQNIGAKKVMLVCSFGLAFVSLGYSFATKLVHFYMLAFINGIFYNGLSLMAVGVLISIWFDGKKGLALGLAYAGSGLGAAIMVPIINHFIEITSWQWAYRFMCVLGLVVLLPTIILLIKNKPEDMNLEPLPLSPTEHKRGHNVIFSNITLKEALKTKRFWLLIIVFFLTRFFSGAANTHTTPYISDLGYSTVFASAVVSVFMLVLTMGKVILGYLYDRFGIMTGNIIISVFVLGFPILALLSFMPAVPWIYAVFIGIASCSSSVPVPLLITRHCGEKDFPRIFGFCSMIAAMAPSLSVPAMGYVFDTTGSYKTAWIILFGLSIVITISLIWSELLGKKAKKEALAVS